MQFTPAAGGQVGGVKEIRMIEMRGEDMPNGDPLSGLTVQIAENSFLIGFMRGSAESTNTGADARARLVRPADHARQRQTRQGDFREGPLGRSHPRRRHASEIAAAKGVRLFRIGICVG
jgi:hypothetical protein